MGFLDWVANKLDDAEKKLSMTPDQASEKKENDYREKCQSFIKHLFIKKIIDTGDYVELEYADKKNTENADNFDMMGFDARFDKTINFKDGYSAVRKGEHWGIINSTGEIIVEPIYEDIIIDYLNGEDDVFSLCYTKNMFSDGLVNVKLNGKWGFINKTGKMVIEPKYEKIGEYSVWSNNWFTGYGFYNGLTTVTKDGLSYLMNLNEEKIAVSKSRYPDMDFYITESICDYYKFDNGDDECYGLINKETGEMTDPDWGEICIYDKTIFAKEIGNDLFGVIDEEGDFIKEPEFLEVDKFSNGLFVVKLAEFRYKIINDTGEFIDDTEFAEIGPYINGYARVYIAGKEGGAAYVDIEGKIALKPICEDINGDIDYVDDFGDNGYAAIFIDNGDDYLSGYIDTSGDIKIKPQFDDARAFSNGLAPVCKNRKWGFINEEGKIVIDYQFEDAHVFSNGFAAICKNEKWGFIDKNGNIAIECQFDKVHGFDGKYASVFINNVSQSELNEYLSSVDIEDFNCYAESLWVNKGGVVFRTKPDNVEYKSLSFIPYESNQTAKVSFYGECFEEFLWGYYKIENGRRVCVIKPQFAQAFAFDRYGCAEVCMPNGEYKFIKVK